MTTISVCIATVRPATVGATIASIMSQTWSDWELIVVGQGNHDVLQRAVRAASGDEPRVRYLHAERRGLSAARNAALRTGRGAIFASTDDDCEARSDWLAVLAEYFDGHPEVGLIGGSVIAPPALRRGPSSCLSIVPGEALYDTRGTSGAPPSGFNWVGANFAVRTAVAQRVGRFDELLGEGAMFLSAEDLDYSHRLRTAGVAMLSTPRSVVFHTFGRRYGVRAAVRYWHGQGTGYGAVLAKLTLRGDPNGRADARTWVREYPTRWMRPPAPGHGPSSSRPTPGRLISDSVRLPALLTAYRRCVRHFRVDEEGLLRPNADGRGTLCG